VSVSWKPSREQIAAALNAPVEDVIASNLKVLFCGINPGLYSGAVGHHFARPGNRFWPTLHLSGFTGRRLSAFEERELLASSLGVTNFVNRATATADGVERRELVAGRKALEAKALEYSPSFVAILGLGAYRTAFGAAKAAVGPQSEKLGPARLWLLPNPSGLNAHYQLDALTSAFASLRVAAGPEPI